MVWLLQAISSEAKFFPSGIVIALGFPTSAQPSDERSFPSGSVARRKKESLRGQSLCIHVQLGPTTAISKALASLSFQSSAIFVHRVERHQGCLVIPMSSKPCPISDAFRLKI